MDDFVTDMHLRSGLLDEIRSSITMNEASELTLNFIKEHIQKPRSVPLCGNSIGTDRRFLDVYMPDIENFALPLNRRLNCKGIGTEMES